MQNAYLFLCLDMFIFFFGSKEKTNQKKKLPPSIYAIQNVRLPAAVFDCVNNGGIFVPSFDYVF